MTIRHDRGLPPRLVESLSRKDSEQASDGGMKDHVRGNGHDERPHDACTVDVIDPDDALERVVKRVGQTSNELEKSGSLSRVKSFEKEPYCQERVENSKEVVENARDSGDRDASRCDDW